MDMLRLLLRFLLAVSLVSVANAESLANNYFSESSVNAGFVTRINQGGLDLLAEFLKDRVKKFAYNTEIPINFTTVIKDKVPVTFSLVSSQYASYDASSFQSQIDIIPSKGLVWTGSYITSTITSVYKIAQDSGTVFGSSNMTLDGTKVEIYFTTDINQDGHLKTEMASCKVHPRQVAINFSHTDAVYIYFGPIVRFYKENVDEILCSKFYSELMPSVSNRLMNTPMSAILFEHYFINYGLLNKINYTDKFIEMQHRGNSFAILRQGRSRLNDFRLPFKSSPMQLPNQTYGMVDFYLSNYTLSSLLFWMNHYRKFDYEISKDHVGTESLAGYLRTNCGAEDVCAGTLFPALAKRFPNGVVQIKTHTTTHPQVSFEMKKGVAALESQVEAFVQQSSAVTRFLTAKMTVNVSLTKFAFKNYELTSEMKIEKFKIIDVVSSVNGIDAQSLEFLVSALNELVIAEDLSRKLKGGIKLPIMFDFTEKSATVAVENNALRISVDFCYDDKCEAIAESKDDVDYYDAVKS